MSGEGADPRQGADPPQGADARPLIVTLRLDPMSFERLDGLRRAHFPAALNRLSAHLTLFHHLPGERLAEVCADLAQAARHPGLRLRFAAPRLLGRGVAFDVEAAGLMEVRRELARRWTAVLSAQDRQGFRPHVTVQNKVEPTDARRLRDDLASRLAPWDGTGEALQLWRYLGGTWAPEGEFTFAA